jgi:hypothetical protein
MPNAKESLRIIFCAGSAGLDIGIQARLLVVLLGHSTASIRKSGGRSFEVKIIRTVEITRVQYEVPQVCQSNSKSDLIYGHSQTESAANPQHQTQVEHRTSISRTSP